MKCQNLFSWENKKKDIVNLLSVDLAQRVVKINETLWNNITFSTKIKSPTLIFELGISVTPSRVKILNFWELASLSLLYLRKSSSASRHIVTNITKHWREKMEKDQQRQFISHSKFYASHQILCSVVKSHTNALDTLLDDLRLDKLQHITVPTRPCYMLLHVTIARDKMLCLLNLHAKVLKCWEFFISWQTHMLWVLIRSAFPRHF